MEELIEAGADVNTAVVYDDTVEPNRPRTLEERMRARPQVPLWLAAGQLDTLQDAPPLFAAARLGHAEVSGCLPALVRTLKRGRARGRSRR